MINCRGHPETDVISADIWPHVEVDFKVLLNLKLRSSGKDKLISQ